MTLVAHSVAHAVREREMCEATDPNVDANLLLVVVDLSGIDDEVAITIRMPRQIVRISRTRRIPS
jgi:hypothetical protein